MIKTIFILILLTGTVQAAEVLVWAKDICQSADCAKSGDVAAVRPDGHVWGSKEVAPMFKLVKYPGVAETDLKYLEEQQTKEVVTKDEKGVDMVSSDMIALRKYKLTSLKDTKTDISLAGKDVAKTQYTEKSIEVVK